MTYQTKRKISVNSLLKHLLLSVVICILPLIYNAIFPQHALIIKRSYYWVIAISVPIVFIIELFRERLFEINFDDEKRLINFSYKSIISKIRVISLSYKNAKVEIEDNTSVERWFRKSLTVYFLKNDLEIAEVNSRKDGFSVDTIKQLCDKVNQIASEGK